MSTKAVGNVPRQLIVGLDAMEWSLVERWANEGKLPTFRGLIANGVRAELTTTAAQLPDTVWACIYTGTNPSLAIARTTVISILGHIGYQWKPWIKNGKRSTIHAIDEIIR